MEEEKTDKGKGKKGKGKKKDVVVEGKKSLFWTILFLVLTDF